MRRVTIYHNPKCGTSRNTLALLHEKGVEPEVVEYLKTPPDAGRLDEILKKMGEEPVFLLRWKEGLVKELGLSPEDERSRRDWIQIMASNPILINRPVVVVGAKARLCRPAETVLEML